MRVGGMLGASCTNAIVIALLLAARANALPLQYLPEIPGYIPVYIRYGDQPLEDINPVLAEAFNESPRILNSIREIPLDEPPSESFNKDLTDRNDIQLNFKEETAPLIAAKLLSNKLISITPQEISSSSQKSESQKQNYADI